MKCRFAVGISVVAMTVLGCASSPPDIGTRAPSSPGAAAQQQDATIPAAEDELFRAVSAALDHAKATQTGPDLLNPRPSGLSTKPHDSTLVARLAPGFVRVLDPAAPEVMDTLYFAFEHPIKVSPGNYSIAVSHTLARKCPAGGIGHGGGVSQYSVSCGAVQCVPTLTRRIYGVGACKQPSLGTG